MAKIKKEKAPKPPKLTTPSAGENAEHLKLSCVADGDAKCHSHSGKQFDSFLLS